MEWLHAPNGFPRICFDGKSFSYIVFFSGVLWGMLYFLNKLLSPKNAYIIDLAFGGSRSYGGCGPTSPANSKEVFWPLVDAGVCVCVCVDIGCRYANLRGFFIEFY